MKRSVEKDKSEVLKLKAEAELKASQAVEIEAKYNELMANIDREKR